MPGHDAISRIGAAALGGARGWRHRTNTSMTIILDHADIDVLLEQVRGKAVAQCVRTNSLADAGDLRGFLNRAV